MKPGLSILLAAGVFSAHAGIITSAGIVADRSGTRIVLSATEEPLSRSSVESDGTLRIEVQGSRSTLSGTHALPSNAAYASVEATTRELEGGAVSVFRFQPRRQGGFAKVKHREWDGSALAFLLDKEPAKSPMVDFWTVPVATTHVGSQVFASLTVVPALQDVRAWGVGDFETVEFRFPSPTIKAELVGSGKKFVIRLGKARLAGKLAPPASATKLILSIAASKDDGGDAITITLKQDARSILLARAGSSVVLRMVSTSANPVAWNWNSKAGKLESFNAASLPSDEAADLASVRKGLSTSSGEGFSVEGSKSPTEERGTLAAGSGGSTDAGMLSEAQKLEAERRKSREFTDRKVAEGVAQQEAVDKQNRVVYNTFGIRDPFIPLEPDDIEGGLNIDQMKVVGIIASPTRPMAVLEHASQPGLSVALKEGDAIQNGRVLKIERDRVVFLLEEFGVSRQFALKLQAPKGDKS
jgi:hypothetical protein